MPALRAAFSSSPRRSFALIPAAVCGWEVLRGRSPVRGGTAGALLMSAGFALYRGAGMYRTAQGGGGPGFVSVPDRLVTTGIYGVSRNPMYLGHLIFLGGLVLLTRSPLAILGLALQRERFAERIALDERRMADLFGSAYDDYLARVPRWLPGSRPDASRYVLFHRIPEPDSARIRSRVMALGLKSRIDFQNAETDGREWLARLGGRATPALWDGRRLVTGADAVELELARGQGRP